MASRTHLTSSEKPSVESPLVVDRVMEMHLFGMEEIILDHVAGECHAPGTRMRVK